MMQLNPAEIFPKYFGEKEKGSIYMQVLEWPCFFIPLNNQAVKVLISIKLLIPARSYEWGRVAQNQSMIKWELIFFFFLKQTEKQVSLNSCKAGITEAIFIGLYFYAWYMVSCRFFNCLYLKDTGNQNRQWCTSLQWSAGDVAERVRICERPSTDFIFSCHRHPSCVEIQLSGRWDTYL